MTNVHRRTNCITIGQMVAGISHLTIFKMAAICHLRLKNFEQLVSSGGLICVIVQNCSKSAERFWRYCNFSIFKMDVVCPRKNWFCGLVLGREQNLVSQKKDNIVKLKTM